MYEMIIILGTKYLAVSHHQALSSQYNNLTYLCIRYDMVIHHDVVIISLINTHCKIVLFREHTWVIEKENDWF